MLEHGVGKNGARELAEGRRSVAITVLICSFGYAHRIVKAFFLANLQSVQYTSEGLDPFPCFD